MSGRTRELEESITGTGEVYKEDKVVSVVEYVLRIYQEYVVSSASAGIEKIPTTKNIFGHIAVISGEKNLPIGETLTLRLQDGRRWSFWISNRGGVPGTYRVISHQRRWNSV